LAKNIRVSERGKKSLTRLGNGFVFLLAKPEFYSHLASWRVVIHTPGLFICFIQAGELEENSLISEIYVSSSEKIRQVFLLNAYAFRDFFHLLIDF
jgi:hypothetical protein